MKFIYFGTPDFAARILGDLIDHGFLPQAVVTNPDRPKGRTGVLQPTSVKQLLLDKKIDIPIYQPEKASSEEFRQTLEQYQADLFVIVAYGEIIKQHVLDMPKYGCINVHASLLPKYRGAAPIQRAIMEGEKETGVSIMYLVKKMDAGDVILQKSLPIDETDTAGEVELKLADLGSKALLELLPKFEKGEVKAVAQEESKVTFAPKLHHEDGEIFWNVPVKTAFDRIRGVTPRPGAWCWVWVRGEKKRLKILKACKVEHGSGLFMRALDGAIELLEVQLEGKKAIQASEFIRGFQLENISFKESE